MQVKVGTVIKYKGENCVVTEIKTLRSTYFAKEDSSVLADSRPNNVQYLQREIDSFQEGDIVTAEQESIELKVPGKNIFYIYTKYKITKEAQDGQQGTESRTAAGSVDQTEGTRQGDQSGESAGEQSAREDNRPVHQDG